MFLFMLATNCRNLNKAKRILTVQIFSQLAFAEVEIMLNRLTLRHKLIAILLLTVTIPIMITGELMMSRAESALLDEKKNKLFGYAHLLDSHLSGTYEDILIQAGAQKKDRQTKIKILNQVLRSYTDEVAASHPGVGIGYYSKELDAILTYGPSKDFANTIGQSIFPGHQGYTVMESGQEMVQVGELVRGPIMNCMIPVIRQGKVIGYIWSNELMEDIETQIDAMERKVYDIILIGLFFALISAYLMTGTITRDVETIKSGLKILHKDRSYRLPNLQGEMGDITTAINEMSEALNRMKYHTESIVTSSPNGLCTLDQAGIITIYNHPTEMITGIPAREAIDRHYRKVFAQWPEIITILDTAFAGELYQNKELTITYKQKQIPILFMTYSLVGYKEERVGILAIFSDLTATKKLEEQVRRADRMAVIGELAAGVAHEVRNPLTAIVGYLQLMAVDFTSEDPRREFTHIISKEIERLNHLIDQLLYFSRPLPPQFIVCDLHQVIQETLLLVATPVNRARVQITLQLANSLPPVKIDPIQFKQVLINILLNSLQAIEGDGEVTVTTSFDSTSGQICTEIKDTGCGIPPENLSRLFDPFFTTKERGTGLGLSVADKIMEVHRGYLEVTSEMGKGSCFFLYLPAYQEVNTSHA